MIRMRRADTLLLVTLLVVAAGGAVLLSQPQCRVIDEHDTEYFWAYEYWRSAFDALSLACGAGLLARDYAAEYNETGRWALAGIGLVGAVAYLAAMIVAIRGLGASLAVWRAPRATVIVLLFLVLQGVSCAVVMVGGMFREEGLSLGSSAQAAIGAFASLGIAPAGQLEQQAWLLAAVAWVSALGWTVWVFLVPPLCRAHVQSRHALLIAGGFTFVLLACAGLVTVFEAPRGGVPPTTAEETLGTAPAGERFGRAVVQVTCAAGAGIATEPLRDRGVSEGTKIVLALLVLAGAASYAPGGGATWLLILWASAGTLLGGRNTHRSSHHFARWLSAGLAVAFGLVVLAVVCAVGLLLIESQTGSRFADAPRFADALLDACSAAGGGGLSGGLTETLTSRNLASGMGQSQNLYAYGMVWLMLTMLAGRLLPVVVLRRLSESD